MSRGKGVRRGKRWASLRSTQPTGLHFNPVKHGYVQQVADWPFSSFHRYVRQGLLPVDWAGAAVMLGLDE